MCSTELDPQQQASACGSCALHTWVGGCALQLTACPSCGYHALPSELREPQPAPFRPVRAAAEAAPGVADSTSSLHELRAGSRARVAALAGDQSVVRRLIAYGIAPGAEIELLQRAPAFIVRVDATELAFAPEIAADIRVLAI